MHPEILEGVELVGDCNFRGVHIILQLKLSSNPGTPGREANFQDKSAALSAFSQKAAAAAGMVAAGVRHNKRLADQLIHNAQEV